MDYTAIRYTVRTTLAALLLTLPLAACHDDEGYTAGPEPATTGLGVYFPASNPVEFLRTDEDEKTVSFTLRRDDTQGTLSVPLELRSKTDNISTVQQSVTFADGQAEAQVQVSYTGLDTAPACTLAVPDAYTNPYRTKDGMSVYSFSVYRLVTVSNYVEQTIYPSSSSYIFGHPESSIAQYQGANKFLWRNFLGSGIDLKFRIDGHFDADNVYNCYGSLVPLDHAESDTEGWYLTVDEQGKGGYATWTPLGSDVAINQFIYFWYEYEGSTYFYVDLRQTASEQGICGYGYFYSAVVDEDANYQSCYFIIHNQ